MSWAPPRERFARFDSERELKGKAETVTVRAVETARREERKCMMAGRMSGGDGQQGIEKEKGRCGQRRAMGQWQAFKSGLW